MTAITPTKCPGLTGDQLRPPDISKSRLTLILLLSCSERAFASPHGEHRRFCEETGAPSRQREAGLATMFDDKHTGAPKDEGENSRNDCTFRQGVQDEIDMHFHAIESGKSADKTNINSTIAHKNQRKWTRGQSTLL